MSDILVKLNNISKKYRINPGGISDVWYLVKRRFTPGVRGMDHYTEIDPNREIWALKDISFELKRGEALGVIGANGAGKTTLLKILSRITNPTSGELEVRGRVGALIEVGAGFHNELTGRENIYMNGAILGMARSEIKIKFKQIVEFSGIGKFLDTPIKKYSSGMRIRLGFSIAAYIKPDVLLIDEILAVGDISFQRKCLDKMAELKNGDTTIIFVSHNLKNIQSLCSKVLWIEKGENRGIGKPEQLIAEYINANNQARWGSDHGLGNSPGQRWGSGEVKIVSVVIGTLTNPSARYIEMGDSLRINVTYNIHKVTNGFRLWLVICDKDDKKILGSVSDVISNRQNCSASRAVCCFNSIPLLPAEYYLTAGILDSDLSEVPYDRWAKVASFVINNPKDQSKYGYIHGDYQGVVQVSSNWET